MWWYDLAKHLLRPFLRLVFDYRVIGKENIPTDTGFVVCSNHKSAWDVVISGASYDPPITFMAKKELFHNKIAGFFLRKLRAFPISRGASDLTAIKNSVKVLKEGQVLNIYPEGTRVRDGKKHAYKPGAALIAHMAHVPILPCAICGEYKWRGHVRFVVGKPICLDQYDHEKLTDDELREIMNEVMLQVENMKKGELPL